MGFLSILALAVGLAMDALAVSIAIGIGLGRVTFRQNFRLAFHFGLFQFLMPVLGWAAGMSVERWVAPFDHWIALGLLSFIGGRMILGGLGKGGENGRPSDPTRGVSLAVLSLATSIDALAVGLSLSFLRVGVWYPAAVIGVVTAVITTLGLHLGRPLGARFGKRMEIVGGLVLIAIGVRIVIAHLFG